MLMQISQVIKHLKFTKGTSPFVKKYFVNKYLLLSFLLFFSQHNTIYSISQENDYFQQEVNHKIKVKLDDSRHMLMADIETEYINNSPDTLLFIYIHLWPNAYSSNNTAFAKQQLKHGNLDFNFSWQEHKGFIDSLDFEINDNKISWRYFDDDNTDIAIIFPNEPVLPGDTIIIKTPFRVKFPHSFFSRLGHNKQAYHVTQWYPKPAVYDKFGWHPMPYLDIGEFYSEFGNFDVEITLPDNYIVASSGELLTESERTLLDSLAYDWHMILFSYQLPDNNEFPPSSDNYKSLNYRLENAHDFAWVADKRFFVLKDSVFLDNTNEYVVSQAFFVQDANQWENIPLYINRAIKFMSENIGNYPYKNFTAVQIQNSGGANMEYPGLTTISPISDEFQLEEVIAHEVIHNWHYGILAYNERNHPWLDEGFTSYYDNRYTSLHHPSRKFASDVSDAWLADFFDIGHYPYNKTDHISALYFSRLNIDQPPALKSNELNPGNYFAMVYYKTAISINHLEKYLGTEEFDRIMKLFYEKWKFKHPYPSDLRRIFETESGKDLSWFFDDLIASTKKLNYKAKKIERTDENYIITIENKGDIAAPIPLAAMNKDEIQHIEWLEGFSGANEVAFPKGDYTHFTIDPDYITFEYKRNKNTIYNRKFFPRANTLELQPLASLENPLKTQTFYSPAAGWNNANGLMAGMMFYNQVIPFKSTELFVMPMFAFGNGKLAGQGWAYKTFFNRSRKIFHSIKTGIDVKSYGLESYYFEDVKQYLKVEPSLKIVFNPGISPKKLKNNLELRAVFTGRDMPYSSPPTDLQQIEKRYNHWNYELSYFQAKDNTLNNYSLSSTIQADENIIKAWVEATYSLIYDYRRNAIDIRLFAGNFFKQPGSNSLIDYRFRLGSHAGKHDYLYDNTYLGRYNQQGTLLGNQVYRNDGGFRIITPVGQTDKWMVAINTSIDLPYMPVKVFGDFGTYHNAANAYPQSELIPYVLGLEFEPVKGIFSVYFPLIVSPDIEKAAGFNTDNYLQRVSFTLRFDKLNPFAELQDFIKFFY